MLKTVNAESLDKLIEETVPKSILLSEESQKNQQKVLGEPISEQTALNYLKEISKQNIIDKSYIGGGYNPVIIPPVILRNILENPAWYTSYTPYQAEISQGRLESLLNYQTLITELTGLPIANASLLDEATSAAEAMYLAYNTHNGKRKDFFVSDRVFPFIKDVLRTRAHYLGINIIEGDINDKQIFKNKNIFGVIVQNPDNLGLVRHDLEEYIQGWKQSEIVTIIAADILSLVLCKSPAEMGFDIAVGSAQRFGVPMMNGGPHAGFIAVKDEYKRKIPGRVIGISKDRHGNPALRLCMQTREQHIRRDKATSNICTAQALLANMAAFYALFHGKQGLIQIAKRVNLFANILSEKVFELGYYPKFRKDFIFDTVTLTLNSNEYQSLKHECDNNNISFREIDSGLYSFTINETTTLSDLEEVINIFAKAKNKDSQHFDITTTDVIHKVQDSYGLNQSLRRKTEDYLNQDIFNKYSSESQLLRYIYYLQLKDISLCNSMITLGSCTMKMNATSELVLYIIII
jgi:glycine dehydrogenase